MMLRIFVTLLFFVSVILLPWYVAVFLGIIVISFFKGYVEVMVGGILLDVLFGAPIASLGGFAYVYTMLFAGLSLVAFVLRRVMLG